VNPAALDATELALDPQRAVLLVVDVQERLVAAMPDETAIRAQKNIALLIEAARRFELPVLVTEQYPKGLGKTTEPVETALAALTTAPRRLEKLEFSACAASGFAAVWDDVRRDQWIVTGMETHVCVYQTVRALVGRGAIVHVPADAVVSRTQPNWEIGLDLMRRSGAVLTSTEVVVFDLLQRAGTDDFKALSRLIK
jgi:nicotinamidase-related amidase